MFSIAACLHSASDEIGNRHCPEDRMLMGSSPNPFSHNVALEPDKSIASAITTKKVDVRHRFMQVIVGHMTASAGPTQFPIAIGP